MRRVKKRRVPEGWHRVRLVLVSEWDFQSGAHAHYRGTAETFGKKTREQFFEGSHLPSTAWCWSASYRPSLFKRDWRTRTA